MQLPHYAVEVKLGLVELMEHESSVVLMLTLALFSIDSLMICIRYIVDTVDLLLAVTFSVRRWPTIF